MGIETNPQTSGAEVPEIEETREFTPEEVEELRLVPEELDLYLQWIKDQRPQS